MVLNKIIVFISILAFISCSKKREKDNDEIVLNENIQEKDGFYYIGDCEEHIGNLYSGSNHYYHGNGKLKGNFTLKNGIPEGHWEQYNTDGTKKLDIYFNEGKVIKRIKHN